MKIGILQFGQLAKVGGPRGGASMATVSSWCECGDRKGDDALCVFRTVELERKRREENRRAACWGWGGPPHAISVRIKNLNLNFRRET